MKLVGIAGSIAEQSYNRTLLEFISRRFNGMAEIEMLNIDEVPLFDLDNDQTSSEIIQKLNRKILAADGVIIATPEHNHTVPAALKNVIEWLSYKVHPFDGKPVMIVGASYYTQGSSRSQLHLRQILEAPGVDAVVLPGHEFLLGNVKNAFDEQGDLKDTRTTHFLKTTLENFLQFVTVINMIDKPAVNTNVDLSAQSKSATKVEGVDMSSDDWLNDAVKKTQAVSGDTYVKLDCGLLTVDQLNYLLKSIPIELTYVDENNQFLYYNRVASAGEMLGSRSPEQVGDSLFDLHPKLAIVSEQVKQVVSSLRDGETKLVSKIAPTKDDRKIAHYYQAMHDDEHNYKGINEMTVDLAPVIADYLRATGQKLVPDPSKVDVTSGASQVAKKPTIDATTSASKRQ